MIEEEPTKLSIYKDDESKSSIRNIQLLMVFYGISTLIPNAAILTDMDYFIDKVSGLGFVKSNLASWILTRFRFQYGVEFGNGNRADSIREAPL
jgi:hypothetical protein